MPSEGAGEELCATAARLAEALTDYEHQGGQDLANDVLGDAPYRAVFCADESSGHLDRPSARGTIVLRSGADRDVVIATAGGGAAWYVERLRHLAATASLAEGERVAIDDA